MPHHQVLINYLQHHQVLIQLSPVQCPLSSCPSAPTYLSLLSSPTTVFTSVPPLTSLSNSLPTLSHSPCPQPTLFHLALPYSPPSVSLIDLIQHCHRNPSSSSYLPLLPLSRTTIFPTAPSINLSRPAAPPCSHPAHPAAVPPSPHRALSCPAAPLGPHPTLTCPVSSIRVFPHVLQHQRVFN